MRFFTPLLLALATSVSAAGTAVVLNNSTLSFYVWSVGGSIGERKEVKAGGIYWEPIHRDEKTGGIAIKMTKGADGLFNGEPQQVFSYTLDGDKVWYDLSSVFGAPFAGYRLEVTSDTGGPIIWPAGMHPGGSQVKVAPSNENVWFTVYGKK